MENLKILVVDDATTTRSFIKYGLGNYRGNIMIHEASDGREARLKLESDRFDLVLCDWEMPHMTGEDLLKWLRGHDTLKDTKFIMITTKSDKESVLEAVKTGVNGYLVKPFSMDKLLQKMAEVDGRFDRRQHERVELSGSATMGFGTQSPTGEIIDISMGGFFATFSRKAGIPQILERTVVEVKNREGSQASGIDGFVIRIQAAEAFPDSEYIKVAVKFLDMDENKKKELQHLISSSSGNGANK
jgi:DNA-binding response OmpR family regulator